MGCATGIFNGILNGTEPSCDCGKESKKNVAGCHFQILAN